MTHSKIVTRLIELLEGLVTSVDNFDKETALKLKEYVYASGNTEDLMTQYIKYRGSEPEIEPLLKKRGLD